MSRYQSIGMTFLAVLSLVVFTARGVNAAPIVYGAFLGDTIDYLGVQEESSTEPPNTQLFGPPTVAGDAMDFNPQAFAASSSGLDSDVTDSNLQFMVKAHANKAVTMLNFTEAGDTTLTGLAGEAQTTVGTIIHVEIQELNIAGVLTPVSISLPPIVMPFNPKNDFKLSIDGAGSKAWTGGVIENLIPHGVVTKLGVSLDNTLTAASVAGTSAFIQKKDADALVITVTTRDIPEPSSLAIVMIATLLAGLFGRRSSK